MTNIEKKLIEPKITLRQMEMLTKEMRGNGFSVSKKANNRSKRHIAIAVQKSLHRKGKGIKKEVKEYIKKDYPATAREEVRFI